MNDEPKNNSADLVGHVLDATSRLSKSRNRRTMVLITVLLLVIAVLGIYIGNLRASNNRKDTTASKQQATIAALTNKSAEQTIAEVQLRTDVNELSTLGTTVGANHSVSIDALCAVMAKVGVAQAEIKKDCPK